MKKLDDLKEQRLDVFEMSQLESQEIKEKTDQGFFEKLTETILNNLQVEIKNVHFRYEDTSNPIVSFLKLSLESYCYWILL